VAADVCPRAVGVSSNARSVFCSSDGSRRDERASGSATRIRGRRTATKETLEEVAKHVHALPVPRCAHWENPSAFCEASRRFCSPQTRRHFEAGSSTCLALFLEDL
jgi:hypothetical protein